MIDYEKIDSEKKLNEIRAFAVDNGYMATIRTTDQTRLVLLWKLPPRIDPKERMKQYRKIIYTPDDNLIRGTLYNDKTQGFRNFVSPDVSIEQIHRILINPHKELQAFDKTKEDVPAALLAKQIILADEKINDQIISLREEIAVLREENYRLKQRWKHRKKKYE